MIKMYYRLMAKGKRNAIRLFNGQFILPTKPIDAVYYGSEAYVIGKDEESCLNAIRPKMKTKYIGFKIIKQEEMK